MPRNLARNLNRHSDGSGGRYREEDENTLYAHAPDERAVLESDDDVPAEADRGDASSSAAKAKQKPQP